jgi:outer membrane receptor protein involved in Fe transport
MKRILPLLVLLFVGFGLVGEAHAAVAGKIAGRVVDDLGDPLPGVNVVVVGTTIGSITDADGYYAILNVPPGTVAVRASFVGYTPVVVENVQVQTNRTTEVDFTLREETVQGDEVVVIAERPLVQRDLTSSSVSVSAEQLKELPVQNFNDVVNLQAGVVDGHFRGGRTGEVSYLVDGIPINDVYDNTYAYQVENNAIQEVEIISGTFNAEYGQAQSGVVNIVTKDGGSEYHGSGSGYLGDYLSTRTDQFQRLGDVSPTGAYEAQGALSGPVPGLGERLTFFTSGRFVRNNGYLYGQRIVQPISAGPSEGRMVEIDGREVFVPALGDSSYVSMNWSQQATGQLKLTARLFGRDKLSVSGLLQTDKGQNYDHLFRYNPDGIPTVHGDSWSATGTYTRTFGSASFLEVKGAFFNNEVRSAVYDDPLDPRYPADDALRQLGGNFSFFRGGAILNHFSRQTQTLVGRADFTSQITRQHLVKTGVEVRSHRLDVADFDVRNNPDTGNEPAIPEAGTPAHVRYSETPIEGSAYVQDKMEFDYLVVNAGVRLDYFDARGEVLDDFSRPTTSPRTATSAKWQVSPRIGLAYPMSDRGVVHVSYGHFFQMPPFEYLYTNPDYIYSPEDGLSRAFGFPDLEPQQTVAYEIGLQQAFGETIGLTLTAYYKDIRNLLGTRLETIVSDGTEDFPAQRYGRFINRDYGQVKGFIVEVEKRRANGFELGLDYTFQIARGNASDPLTVLLDEAADREPEKQLVPLDWDRRHQLNLTATVGDVERVLVSVVGKLGSGLPYTPSRADERIGLENSARRPGFLSFDLYATRQFDFRGLKPGVFLRIYNLFDANTVTNIYTDTGQPFPNLLYYPGEPQGLNTKDEFLRRPDFYGAPRQVTLGLNVEF